MLSFKSPYFDDTAYFNDIGLDIFLRLTKLGNSSALFFLLSYNGHSLEPDLTLSRDNKQMRLDKSNFSGTGGLGFNIKDIFTIDLLVGGGRMNKELTLNQNSVKKDKGVFELEGLLELWIVRNWLALQGYAELVNSRVGGKINFVTPRQLLWRIGPELEVSLDYAPLELIRSDLEGTKFVHHLFVDTRLLIPFQLHARWELGVFFRHTYDSRYENFGAVSGHNITIGGEIGWYAVQLIVGGTMLKGPLANDIPLFVGLVINSRDNSGASTFIRSANDILPYRGRHIIDFAVQDSK
jgi:hypothetical protein